jgi:hypothetical protein
MKKENRPFPEKCTDLLTVTETASDWSFEMVIDHHGRPVLAFHYDTYV